MYIIWYFSSQHQIHELDLMFTEKIKLNTVKNIFLGQKYAYYCVQSPYDILINDVYDDNPENEKDTIFDYKKQEEFDMKLIANPHLLYNFPNNQIIYSKGPLRTDFDSNANAMYIIFNFIKCYVNAMTNEMKYNNKIYILQHIYKFYKNALENEQMYMLKIVLVLFNFGYFDTIDVRSELKIVIDDNKTKYIKKIIINNFEEYNGENEFITKCLEINVNNYYFNLTNKMVNMIHKQNCISENIKGGINYHKYTNNGIDYYYSRIDRTLFKLNDNWKLLYEQYTNNNSNYYNIYCIYEDDIIKCSVEIDINDNGINQCMIKQIKDIYINDCLVLKRDKLDNLPFIHIYPNKNNLIYKKNGMYHMAYITISKYDFKEISILETFIINPNNNMFVNKLNIKSQQRLEHICQTYGLNKYNIYFEKCNKDKKDEHIDDKKIIPYQDFLGVQNIVGEILSIRLFNKNNDYLMGDIKKKTWEKTIKLNLTNINNFIDTTNNIIKKYNDYIYDENNTTVKLFKNNNMFYDIFITNYNETYKYITYLRYVNILNKIIEIDNTNENYNMIVESLVGIYNEKMNARTYKLNYAFEIIFEIIFGNSITDEQYETYSKIINSYIDFIDEKTKNAYLEVEHIFNFKKKVVSGGNYPKKIPIHHLMMGKGKSSVITPLLCLYFNLVFHKKVIVIVPQHLKLQTIDSLTYYITFFNINVEIMTDNEIKHNFLGGKYINEKQNSDYIMLIDEFDSILNPLASNYNEIVMNDAKIDSIYKYIFLKFMRHYYTGTHYSADVTNMIDAEITNINTLIKKKILKENINWGINPITCLALPYFGKDTYDEKCLFTSPIITIYLTLYYHYIINKKNITPIIYNYMITYELFQIIFNLAVPLNYDEVSNFIKMDEDNIFNKIMDHIISNIRLTRTQLNISFIDILNIKNMYKVGYSGTVNIDLPVLSEQFEFDKIVVDNDEKANVEYAIKKATIINYDSGKNIYNKINELIIKNSYGALIDATGAFKNDKNIEIAKMIYTAIKRPIIFLDEKNNKLVYMGDNNVEKYDEYINYINPFLYYSQSHIVGVDIKQDNYPNIIGLCIIDLNMQYTVIAQAIFRLRKLNMGHTINFYINGTGKIGNSEELIKLLHENDDVSKNNKKSYLLLQNIKSSIRYGLLQQNNDLQKVYTEKTFFYFNGQIEKYTNVSYLCNAINNLYNIAPEIAETYYKHIYKDYKVTDCLNDLINIVYNVSINNTNGAFVTQNQMEQQMEKEIKNNVNDLTTTIINLKEPDRYLKEPDFNNDIYRTYFLNNMVFAIEILNNITIYSFINIDTKWYNNTNYKHKYYINLIYIYLNNQLVLIPITFTKYLFDIAYLFDLSLLCLNVNLNIKDGDKKYTVIQQIYNDFNCIKIIKYWHKRDQNINITNEFKYIITMMYEHIYKHICEKKQNNIYFKKEENIYEKKEENNIMIQKINYLLPYMLKDKTDDTLYEQILKKINDIYLKIDITYK